MLFFGLAALAILLGGAGWLTGASPERIWAVLETPVRALEAEITGTVDLIRNLIGI